MIGITRKAITVPAVGSPLSLPVAGFRIIVEKSPDDTSDGVPTIHTTTPDSDPLPAFSAAQYAIDGGFNRLFIKGTAASAGGTLYLLLINSDNVQIRMPNTVE